VSRFIFGPPLPSSAATHERLSPARAIGAFGLDALSSVAYGPDEIVYVLILAGSAGMALVIPIGLAIALLLAIVATSYRQTIYAYPGGGGSYTVARENLGTQAGLVAAAALMVDYLTTVAVSVTAGVEALIAFAPVLDQYRVPLDVAAILLLMVINLRGVREAGAAFVIPTYLFVGSLGLLIVIGIVHVLTAGLPPPIHPMPAPVESLSVLLILRAFAGGCTAMTGVEAIANGVPSFEPPEAQKAAQTLLVLALTLMVLFLGVVFLGRAINAIPSDQANILAQIGQTFAGGTPLFYLVQISASIVLLLAANTSFNGFPRLAAVLADDDFFPHQFSYRGLRLAYSNGINAIGILAILLVIAFGGITHALIPLFAVGVFLCFTLSQIGMVRHWQKTRGAGWQTKLAVNLIGGIVTGLVTIVVVVAKFSEGAWIVMILVPLLVTTFAGIHRHYGRCRSELSLPRLPQPGHRPVRIIVPVANMDRSVASALDYAGAISNQVTAVHVATDEKTTQMFRERWSAWAPGVDLEIIPSPYREIVHPLTEYIERIRQEQPDHQVTVVLPEVITRHLWQEPLHNQLPLAIKFAFLGREGVVVTSVPVHL
jgi:amino acid transporter